MLHSRTGAAGRRLLLLLTALVIAAAVAFAALRAVGNGKGAVEYVTTALDRGDIDVVVTATGTVNPVATVQVGTYVSGPIQKIYVDYNSPVKKGQRIAEIDPKPFQLRVDQAEASLANARARVEKDRADLDLKQKTLRRSRELFAQHLISRAELDEAESAVEQAKAQMQLDQAQVKQAEGALEEAKVQLDYTRIESPVDGIVVSRNVDVGQTVAASFQTPTLFLIAEDLTKMQVNANVSESDIGAVSEGDAATFTVDAFPDTPFEGTVTQVRNAPLTVQNVVTYDVIVSVDNRELKLRPGMTANVSIVTAHRENVLRVPLAALRFRPPSVPQPTAAASPGAAEKTVWQLAADGAPKPVAVDTGIANEQYAEVTGGDLRAGERVIVALRQTGSPEEAPQVLGMPSFRRGKSKK